MVSFHTLVYSDQSSLDPFPKHIGGGETIFCYFCTKTIIFHYLVDMGVSGSTALFWLVGVFKIPLTGVLPALFGVPN